LQNHLSSKIGTSTTKPPSFPKPLCCKTTSLHKALPLASYIAIGNPLQQQQQQQQHKTKQKQKKKKKTTLYIDHTLCVGQVLSFPSTTPQKPANN